MTDRFLSDRHAPSFLAFACLAALAACEPEEHALLLDVHARTDIRTITVQVIPRDGSGSTARVAQSITRDATMLASDAPIRIAVSFLGPVDVVVHVRGDAIDGSTLATRCYSIRGVVRDDALLVTLPPTADVDRDGFPAQGALSCLDPKGVDDSEACDNACAGGVGVDCRGCVGSECPLAAADADDTIYPGADEICADGIDQDCNGVDGACGDQDRDGYEACGVDDTGACDCADADRSRNPNAVEVCGDGIDQNCDGTDAPCDRDGDDFPADLAVGGTPDCDDTDPLVHPDVAGRPTAEVCTPEGATPRDENCNRLIDELTECASDDLDADGAEDCARTGGAPGCDCNDCDPTVGPTSREICGNGIDEDCDVMRRDTPCNANDVDGDGEIAVASGGTDCNDGDRQIGSEAIEDCNNGADDDCDGTTDDCTMDTDGDQFQEPTGCENDTAIVPYTAEVCNGIDDNCDGRIDEQNLTSAAPYDACVLPRAGETDCVDGRCAVQYASSLFHCGGCRLACDFVATDVCAGGTCQCTNTASATGLDAACTSGTTCCPAAGCHNLQDDLYFCGNCANNCDMLYGSHVDRCATGACLCGATGGICADTDTCCSSGCFNTLTDRLHCGRCDNECNLDFATPACVMGMCAVAACTSGRADCDGIPTNGCEVDLSLANNCGACTVACSANGTCTPGAGTFGCTCNGGYSGDGRTCGDIDECGAGAPCGTNSTCTNTVGSYTCACSTAGYASATGDGRNCADIVECTAATACGRDLTPANLCTNTVGSYTCSCTAGFVASGSAFTATCVDVNECLAATACGRNLSGSNTCTNTTGSYTCGCAAGFTPSGSGLTATCVDVDECAVMATCGTARASCTNNVGSYVCTCSAGFTAPAMGGTCGDTDECAVPTTCGVARASCSNIPGSYACTCDPGYTAPATAGTCTDVDECAVGATCGAERSSCTNTTGSYTCGCNLGYGAPASGGSCSNINECAASPATCGRTVPGGGVNSCSDTTGSYTCSCGAGFVPMGSGLTATCADVNECTMSAAQCGRTLGGGSVNSCSNTSGGYTCSCGMGFRASGSGLTATCVDIDECASGTPCGAGGMCTDSSGSYSCVCGPAALDCGGPPNCETTRGTTSNCDMCGQTCAELCCPNGSSFRCRTMAMGC